MIKFNNIPNQINQNGCLPKKTGIKIMKKLLIIAVASSFIFISCSKEAPTQPTAQQTTQQITQLAPQSTPVKVAIQLPQKYVITNVETNWGFAPYEIRFLNANTGQFQTVTLNMGQSLTVCLINMADFSTNFAYSIVVSGSC
jgi:hypothetical protein